MLDSNLCSFCDLFAFCLCVCSRGACGVSSRIARENSWAPKICLQAKIRQEIFQKSVSKPQAFSRPPPCAPARLTPAGPLCSFYGPSPVFRGPGAKKCSGKRAWWMGAGASKRCPSAKKHTLLPLLWPRSGAPVLRSTICCRCSGLEVRMRRRLRVFGIVANWR